MTDEALIKAMKRALMTTSPKGELDDGFRAILAVVAPGVRRRALEEAERIAGMMGAKAVEAALHRLATYPEDETSQWAAPACPACDDKGGDGVGGGSCLRCGR